MQGRKPRRPADGTAGGGGGRIRTFLLMGRKMKKEMTAEGKVKAFSLILLNFSF